MPATIRLGVAGANAVQRFAGDDIEILRLVFIDDGARIASPMISQSACVAPDRLVAPRCCDGRGSRRVSRAVLNWPGYSNLPYRLIFSSDVRPYNARKEWRYVALIKGKTIFALFISDHQTEFTPFLKKCILALIFGRAKRGK